MKKIVSIKELSLLAVVMIPILFLIVLWDSLPTQMPIHWNLNGQADGYGPRWAYPLIGLSLYLLLTLLPFIDPLKKNYEIFGDTYFKLRLIFVLFFSVTNMLVMYNELYHNINLGKIISSSMFLLFALLGNYMGNLRRNYFVGFKLPWTLNNDEVWRKTHVLAGKLWFWGGLFGFVLALTNIKQNFILIPLISIISIIPIVYSYFIHRKLVKE